ncbi:MAG: RNA polymerase-binding protein RbpA [Mycobacteriales bacterium]
MAERVLRGSRLGAASYESDRNTDLAPRQLVPYVCPSGHRFGVPMAEGAEVPASWECRSCGGAALRVDGGEPEAKKGKPARTHWDMLMERRTTEDLEEVLAERLAVLHETRKSA